MDLSSFSNDELLKLRDIKKRSVNLSSLSNDELLKLRDSFTKPTYTKPTYTEQNGFKILDTQKNNLNGYLQGKNVIDAVDKFENLKKEQGLNTALTPFDSIGQEALNGIFGLKKNYKDELSSAKDTKSQISAINNAVSKYGASKPIFGNNEKENYLSDLSDTLYKAHGSRIVKKGNEYFLREANGKDTPLDDGFLNDFGRITRDNIGSLVGAVLGAKKGGMIKSAVGASVGSTFDMKNGADYTEQKNIKPLELAQRMGEEALLSLGGDMAIKALTSKPAINTLKGTAKTALNIADKGLAGVGARHILSQNIGGAKSALKANLGGEYEVKNALESAKDALGADLDNFVRKDLKTINKTSDKKYIQKGIDTINSGINRANEMLKGLNVGKADAELLLSALGHENGVKNILDAVANNPKSAQKIAEISSNLNKSFSDSINEQLAKFESITPKDSFKNSFNQVKKDYANTKDFLIKNSNYQSDFKALSDNLSNILSDTQNISTRGVFNALNGGGNLDNLLNAKNAINEQLGYIYKADFKSSSDFINQKALNEAKDLIESEINSALKNDEKLINLYKSANSDYAKMKNISESNLLNSISRDGKTSIEALNAMLKSSDNINGVNLNDFLGSLGAKDRAVAEANLIRGLMDKNSFNGVVDFRALNQNLASLDFKSEFAKELKSQILSKQSILNNTSDILNSLGDRVIKPKTMSQGQTQDPLKRGETMRANFIVEKLKPLIPYLGNNEALKLHINRAILNANGDFKLAIKNIDNIPSGNLPTPTRNLLNEFKIAIKDIEQVVKSQEPTQIKVKNQANLAKSINGDGFVTYPNKNIYFSDEAKFELSKELQNKTGLQDKISTSLAWLQSRHPEMFHSKRAVKEMIDFILEAPSVSQAKRANSVAMTRVSNNKINDIVVDKNKNKIIHANKRKPNSQEKADSGNALHPHSDTMSDGALKLAENQHLSANTQTIPNQTIKTAETKSTINELTKEQKAEQKAKKEIRGIHNVTYNDKKATYIKTDLENVDSAIRYANTNRDKGAKHIKIRHLMDETKPGYITNQELLNLGNSLREYIKTYKEPFIDKNGARIYEWENKEGVKFRVVVDSSRRDATTAELPQPTATDDIITFYSDRNIKDKMIFRNPKLNQSKKEAENLAQYRKDIEAKYNINPIKEFGTNYAEFYHDGANAIRKLLVERKGQVAGAFKRKELGDIDLVWGEAKTANGDIKGYGLSKIEAKHLNDFASFYGDTPQEKLINGISKIIEKGEIKPRNGQNGVNIEYNGFIIGINKGFNGAGDNKWVVTAFDNSMSKSEKKAKTARTDNFTSEVSNLSQNSKPNYTPKELLSQGKMPVGWKKGATNIGSSTEQPKWANKFKTKMAKMGQEYNDEKITNLANWHKDSHAVTKESDGSPKVFYHGSTAKFSAFKPNPKSGGIWLTTDIERAHPHYTQSEEGRHHLYKVFVNAKKIYRHTDDIQTAEPYSAGAEKFYNDLIKAGYDAIDLMDKDILIVLKPNQIKSIDNKGTFNPRSKMMNGFSTMVMQKAILNLGSGAIGGAMNAGAEQDPNKKHEAFVKGFLLGAGGSAGAIKVLEKSANLAPQLARISQRLANDLPVILNDRPDIIGKALGKTPKDNYNYIFGGENAIGANKAKLKTAQEMSKNGADESEIWAKTGWYKDIDKKWKFEINPLGGKFKKAIKDLFDAKAFKQNNREKLELLQDKAKINDKYQTNLNKLNATLSQKASIITKAKDGLKLSEVLDDKKLFNAYPQLRDVKVRFDELDGEIYDGYYNRTLDEIVLNSNLYNKPEMLRSILYHEMQHKIQSIEGFARGGMDKDVLDYHRLAGEVEARNEQTRLIPSKLNNAKLERTTDLENLEKIAKALPKSQANEQISKELITLKKQDMALDNEYGKISPQRDKEIDRLTDELDNRFNALVEQIDKQELATALLKVYNKTKHPNATADVIPKFRKVVFNDSGMSAIYTPKQKEMKSQDLSVEQKAKQYAKFLSEAKEPTQVAPDELYKAYNKAKKDLNKPKSK